MFYESKSILKKGFERGESVDQSKMYQRLFKYLFNAKNKIDLIY